MLDDLDRRLGVRDTLDVAPDLDHFDGFGVTRRPVAFAPAARWHGVRVVVVIARRHRVRVVVVIARRHRVRVVVVIARRHRVRVVVVIELLLIHLGITKK